MNIIGKAKVTNYELNYTKDKLYSVILHKGENKIKLLNDIGGVILADKNDFELCISNVGQVKIDNYLEVKLVA